MDPMLAVTLAGIVSMLTGEFLFLVWEGVSKFPSPGERGNFWKTLLATPVTVAARLAAGYNSGHSQAAGGKAP